MCVSLGPAKFSNTILYVGEATRNGKLVHVLGYQNTAQNLATSLSSKLDPRLMSKVIAQNGGKMPATGNAMILPFPAAAPMGPENVVDTSVCPRILKDILESVKSRSRNQMKSLGDDDDDAVCFSAPLVFDTGIYTVVLARDARDIPAALARVPAEKRPALNPEIFEAYARWYPGWQIALCCFNNADAIEADPMLWWYEPAQPESYFVPTLDCHTGGVPSLGARTELDHGIAVGVPEGKGSPIAYSKDLLPAEVTALLPRFGRGREFTESVRNGDFMFDKAELAAGTFEPKRVTPGSYLHITL